MIIDSQALNYEPMSLSLKETIDRQQMVLSIYLQFLLKINFNKILISFKQ